MDTSRKLTTASHDRRHFLGLAAGAVAAAQFGAPALVHAQTIGTGPADPPGASRGTHTPFGPVKQIDAGVLNIGYAEAGPADGRVVILLHGWPYDIHSYAEVAPLLADQGYRVIVPHLRGHGTTRFLSGTTFRNAQQSVIALDIIALMDSLNIEKAILAGYDWGARTAGIIAALWPDRCTALVSVTGYLITNRETNKTPLPAKAEWAWWYQFYFATERGRLGLEKKENRHDLARLIWKFNSPTWDFDDATFNRTAAAFDNPDYVSIVIHNYRWRLSLADGDPQYDGLERRLASAPTIAVPTITIDGEFDPFTPAGDGTIYRSKFSGRYAHRVLKVGHNVPQEAPHAFAGAVIDVDHL
jgi:pimeloyl-ACP methyl ester carboxylesterase